MMGLGLLGRGIGRPAGGKSVDIIPDAFSFVDQADVAPGVVITSAPVVLAGLTGATPITITGGEYSINGAAFTSAAGSVVNGDSIRARNTSSSSHSTAVDTVVTIGGVSDTFTSTSWPTDAAWFKLNTGITQAGGFASAWADQSGNGRDLLQAIATNQPAVDGAGVLTFDGIDNYMSAVFTLDQPYTVFMRVRHKTHSTNDSFFSGVVAVARVFQTGTSPNLDLRANTDSTLDNAELVLNTWGSLAAVFNTTNCRLQIDQGTATTGSAGNSNPGGFTLASNNLGTSVYGDIEVKEIVIFPAALDATQRNNINAYLTAYVP